MAWGEQIVQWGPVARVAPLRRTVRLLSVLLLALAVIWLAVGARAVHDPTATRASSTVAQDADCEFFANPGGPARCDHGGDHRAAGRLQPSTADRDGFGVGYPADIPATTVELHAPTARPPARPSLAELQAWRR